MVTLLYGSLIALGTQEAVAQLLLQPQPSEHHSESLQKHFKVALGTFHAPNASR